MGALAEAPNIQSVLLRPGTEQAAGAGSVVVSKVANLLNRPKEAEPQAPQVILPPGVDRE